MVEKREDEAYSRLRIVPPSELNADAVNEEVTASESRGEPATPNANVSDPYDILAEDGTVMMKNNRLTVDDATRQALSHQDIEELKRSAGGKEIIEKILANHAGLDEKTIFSKAKYMLRKTKKYLKRFTVLPMDLGNLIEYVFEKEPPRILEMRQETLGLITAWINVHVTSEQCVPRSDNGKRIGGGRWLVVDETGGLIVAALAERMGILYHSKLENERPDDASTNGMVLDHEEVPNGGSGPGVRTDDQAADSNGQPLLPKPLASDADTSSRKSNASERFHQDFPPPAMSNALTILHPAAQPNISLVKYFGYDANTPDPSHPLHTHLKSLSWLQLLYPDEDPTYYEPEHVSEPELATWKSGKRGTYWKKRRRWERCKAIVDETREGGFEGVVIASNMDVATILPHAVPLVRGGGHVVVYSPTVEPLVKLVDLYSKERRAAYIQHVAKGTPPDPEDFPVDPRLLLAPTLQTSRVRDWQVLPGRTHPMMTGRGGAEGYVFTAHKAVPLEGGVEARGNFSGKRRKVDVSVAVDGKANGDGAVGTPS